MIFSTLPVSLLSLGLLALPAAAQDQIVFDAEHNASTIIGTWSSGSRAVRTGPGFANPANKSFTYPKNAGISYSFNDDYFYEVSRYRFNSNASEPNCIQGVVNWHHGKYSLLNNGSIVLTPLGDGYQQVQDPCAAESNFIEDYNITELIKSWRIFEDPAVAAIGGGGGAMMKLHLFQYDGAPMAPMFQVAATPVMNPTKSLRNVTKPEDAASVARRSVEEEGEGNGAAGRSNVRVAVVMASVAAFVAVLV